MDSLDQRAPECAEIPRFDDGMVNIQELIRIMAESLVNEIMDAQAEDACADGNRRNGYRERALVTSVGTINLRIPKLRRGSYFPEDLLTRYSRVDRAVVAAVSEMVTCGVSTRKVERVAASLGIDRMSASQVSRICESLDDVVADLQERDLSGTSFPYIWVDATYVKCRDGGHVSSCALVTAIGAGADGYRRLLGLDAIDTESYAGWLAFLRSLRERGASGVLCVTSDAHEGLRRAIEEVFPAPRGSAASCTSCATRRRARRPGRRGRRCWRFCTRSSTSGTPPSCASCTIWPAGRSPAYARGRQGCSRMPRRTPWPTWTSPMRTTGASAPTTSRSGPTASSSAAAAWCRSSRPGNR